MCLARMLATNFRYPIFFSQSTCLARMYSATLGGTTRVRRELMARVVPLSSAVVCIESIPFGSLAGQLFSQMFL